MGISGMKQVLNSWNYENTGSVIRENVNDLAKKYRIDFVSNRLDQLVYELLFLQCRSGHHKLILPIKQIKLMKEQPLLKWGRAISLFI